MDPAGASGSVISPLESEIFFFLWFGLVCFRGGELRFLRLDLYEGLEGAASRRIEDEFSVRLFEMLLPVRKVSRFLEAFVLNIV